MNATKFEALAQKNVDHYNEHPVAHTIMVVSYAACTVYVLRRFARRFAENDADVRQMTGQFAK